MELQFNQLGVAPLNTVRIRELNFHTHYLHLPG